MYTVYVHTQDHMIFSLCLSPPCPPSFSSAQTQVRTLPPESLGELKALQSVGRFRLP